MFAGYIAFGLCCAAHLYSWSVIVMLSFKCKYGQTNKNILKRRIMFFRSLLVKFCIVRICFTILLVMYDGTTFSQVKKYIV